ncbi:hypothetical protein PV382_18010 [Streptomyces scabiei]|uniref:hypothetical protein n=1 Tax=Streptomyces scabiei TaxID=1930 RepID=UPI000765BC63|nr:hypothetical protein [Streptomyces scabiei]MDX2996394.1 hypothetical protein [Streptomyces scabiei]MDX3049895.1 hypothetical protein [Streptomyces scabiei]MDX3174172.1 hypothetical protein [Streptomyces scabiei]
MRIPMRVVLGQWSPQQCRKTGYLPAEGVKRYLKETDYSTRIHPGTIIVWSDRKAYRVLEVTERPLDLWPEHFMTEWKRFTKEWVEQVVVGRDLGEQPERATWEHRPLVLVIQPADRPKAKPEHYAVRASRPFYVLPEHYSVCRLCNEIPPCTHATNEAMVDHEMANTERLMAIPAGHCLGCGERITSRMKAVRFPGPNLWRPDWGNDSAVFHARSSDDCAIPADSYRRQWEAKGHAEMQPELPNEAE